MTSDQNQSTEPASNFTDHTPLEQIELSVDASVSAFIIEAAKWSRFLGIVGFVFTGLVVVISLGMIAGGGALDSLPGMEEMPFGSMSFLGVFYLVFAALYFFPSLYLYRFGTKGKYAMNHGDQMAFVEGIMNLKSFFKFAGIFTAIIIGLYALIFVFVLLGAGVGSLLG